MTTLHPFEFPLLQPPFSSPSTSSLTSTPSFPSTQEPHHKNNYSHPSKTAKPKVQSPQRRKTSSATMPFPPRGGLRTPNPLSYSTPAETSTSGGFSPSPPLPPQSVPLHLHKKRPFRNANNYPPPSRHSIGGHLHRLLPSQHPLSLKKRARPTFTVSRRAPQKNSGGGESQCHSATQKPKGSFFYIPIFFTAQSTK